MAGYSLFNDASIRDYQFRSPQWTVGKNFDGTGASGRRAATGGSGAGPAGRQFDERSAGVLNRTCLPSDIIGVVVFCRRRYQPTLRELNEIPALCGIEVSQKAVRDWRAKLLAIMGDELRKRRHGTRRCSGMSRHVDETHTNGLKF